MTMVDLQAFDEDAVKTIESTIKSLDSELRELSLDIHGESVVSAQGLDESSGLRHIKTWTRAWSDDENSEARYTNFLPLRTRDQSRGCVQAIHEHIKCGFGHRNLSFS